jgi:hypothetical protein
MHFNPQESFLALKHLPVLPLRTAAAAAAAAVAAGCVPDLLVDNIITDGTPEPCSPNDPNAELTALLGIRTGMRQMLGQQVTRCLCEIGSMHVL